METETASRPFGDKGTGAERASPDNRQDPVAPAQSAAFVAEQEQRAPSEPTEARVIPAADEVSIPRGQANRLLTEANLNRLRHQWEPAVAQCIAVLREHPSDAAAHSLLGDIYRDQDRLEEAVRWYRMAVELRPNPFDQVNLQKLEAQLARREEKREAQGVKHAPGAVDPIDGIPSGTSTLMGVAPQRWLRGVTIASLAFLALFVLALMLMPSRRVSPVPVAVSTETPIADARSNSQVLPPVKLGGPTILPAGEQPAVHAPSHAAGSGLAPDASMSSVAPPGINGGLTAPPSNIPPAPVQGVAPLSNGDQGAQHIGERRSGASNLGTHGNSLADGMEMEQVQTHSEDGSASITILAGSNAAHDQVIRNVYRAARTVFSNDNTLTHATVTVQSGQNLTESRQVLAAEIDRNAALQADPDHEDLSTLEGRLRLL